jgi:NADP-dependent 3-hydroxy acid dehydrogenase YdfG
LVNAAGIMLPAPIAGADPADWRRMVDVNLLGAGDMVRGILRALAQLERINVNEVLFRPTDQRDW